MRTLRAAIVALTVAITGAVSLAGPASGQSAPETTVVPLPAGEPAGRPSIIPTPNSGGTVEPGEPGSGAQYAVLALTVGGLAAIVMLIARDSRRKRDQRTPKPV